MAAKKKYVNPEVPFSKKITRMRQGHTYEEIFGISVFAGDPSAYRVRVYIYLDTYDFQSVAKVEVWDQQGLKWNTVASIKHPDITGLKNFNYCAEPSEMRFKPEVEELKKQVRFILQMDEMK
jgi:hypothetical protein